MGYSFFKILLSLLVYLPGLASEPDVKNIPAAFAKTDSVMPAKLKVPAKAMLGLSRKGRTIDAWYFPGTSDKKALVIGGMHGSELSSIEVANELIKKLQHEKPGYYNVIVIPCLFPDNAETAKTDPATVGGVQNTGRYSHQTAADPNRQMPSLGKAFNPELPFDHLGRTIEQENQLLLDLIRQFRPDRIANIHAIRDAAHAGIYADPRTDSKGFALGFATDSSLAVDMAAYIFNEGGYVPGNQINKTPTALYYRDPMAAGEGQLQKRNTCGSKLPSNRGQGISLGSWASTAIEDASDVEGSRPAMRLLTIEFPGYKAPMHYTDEKQQQFCSKQVSLYASSILHIFLGNHYAEMNL